MSFDNWKPKWSTIACIQVKYLDMQGNPVNQESAIKELTTEYDEKGNIICTHLRLNFAKDSKK